MTKLRDIILTDDTLKRLLLTDNSNAPVEVMNADGSAVDTQHPFQVDGDSVYEKDINTTLSTSGTFTGDVVDLFNTYGIADVLTDSTATNPKTFTIRLKRPLVSNELAMSSATGDFSNVKIELEDPSGAVRRTVDDTADSTKHTSKVYSFTKTTFISITVSFATADAVDLAGCFIPKILHRAISAIDGYVSETNSTEATLGIGGVFTGTDVDTLNYGMVLVSVYADVASATDGLSVQFRSSLSGTWRESDTFTIEAGAFKTFSVQTVYRFMRIVYTNGGAGQASFDLQTTLKPVYVKPSSHRVGDAISSEEDAELVKAVSTGLAPDGTYKNVLVTNSGNQKISIEEFDDAVATTMADFTDNLEGESVLNVAAVMFGRASDSLVLPVKIEKTTQDTQVIEQEHAEIHSGDHYEITSYVNLSLNNVLDIRITTPDTGKWGHFVFELDVESQTEWFLHEVAVISVAGAAVTAYNNDRNSGNTAGLVFDLITNTSLANANADTDLTGATELKCGMVGSGKRSFGSTDRSKEIILKQNTIYNIRAVAVAAGYVNYDFEWYEHTNKN